MSQYGYNYDSSMSYYPSADYGTGTSGDPQGLGAGSGGVQEHGGHGHGHGHQGHEPHYGSHSQDQSMTASSSTSYGNPYMYSSQVNNQSTQTPSSSSLAGYEHHQQPQQHHHQYYSQQQPTASSSNYHYPSQQQQQQQHVAHSAASSSQPGAMPAPSSSKYSQQTAKSNKSSKHRSSIDQHHLKDVGGGNLGPTAHVKASSTTSEFTKRRNWSQHIIDEVQDFMHVLTPNAVIMFSAPSVQELTGWTVDDVVGKRIYDFIHPDDLPGFKRDFEQSLRDGSNLTLYYRFKMKDDRYTIFETTGHPYYSEEDGVTQCKCFFAVGRPYPSKNTAMLDSFLELKMENERLRQELHIMYREIESGSGPLAGDLGAYGVDLGFDASKGVIDPSTGLVQTNTLMPSSSNTYGALGIGISHAAARGEGSEKKKKKSKADEGEFVCRDCGTVDSPEWRKGPDGPKSLCNACGLRYAKLRSKQEKGGAPAASKAMRSTS